jgi:ABC-2 type transport system ATP-binding protein
VNSRLSLSGLALLTTVVVLTACSSSKSTQSNASPASTTQSSTRLPCVITDPNGPPVATKVAGVASDWTLTSFDGAKIRMHWFPTPQASAAKPAPTVLMGPGWGQAGDTNTKTIGLFGSLGIGSLQKAGYNVLTWDPRGFGQSTGTVEIDSPAFEGKDVQWMLDWVATQPGVRLDGPGDPRVGMAGGSYGGGIQFSTAAIDCRVDAIVPMIAWHSLNTSLDKAETPKNGWSSILIAGAAGKSLDPHIASSYKAATTTAIISPDDKAWYTTRGPGDLVKNISIPTLIVQGTADNLFTLDEGVTNYRTLRDIGVPTSMLWFCGGHGVCLTNPGDPTRVGRATLAWLNRYVKGDQTVSTGPRFDFIDQNGTRYTADDYPVAAGTPIAASGSGTLHLVAAGGSGPAHPAADNKDILAGIAAGITPARATNAVNVAVPFTKPVVVVGPPQLTLQYTGTAPAGTRPTRVFAQLVDNKTGLVLGNQITPIEVVLDGQRHQVSVPLEIVAYTGKPGAKVTLQIVATTTAYAVPRLGGTVTFDKIDVSLPTAAAIAAK